MIKSLLGRIVLPHTLRSFICPSVFWAHHIQLLLISVSSNDFSTTHLAGLCALSVSKIVTGLSADCPPHHSQVETQGKHCVDSLSFFTQWMVNISQTNSCIWKVSQDCNKITCKQKGFSIQQERIKQNCSHKLQSPSYINRCIFCIYYVSLVLRTLRSIAR